MHFIMPVIYPNRCDNEAFLSERIDLTRTDAWLRKKNAGNPEYRYTVFHVVTAAMLKTIHLRPKMNRFIAGKSIYQRNSLSAAFTIKREFRDEGGEALACLEAGPDDTFETLHDKIYEQVKRGRSTDNNNTEDAMELFKKMPRFLSRFLINLVCILDRRGRVPKSLIEEDPYYRSVVLTNLGSIRLHAAYHHLTNWGTTSVFVAIGERKKRPFYDREGNVTMRSSLDLGLTIDERLADGYYYAKTVRLFKKLVENPELLEAPLSEPVVS